MRVTPPLPEAGFSGHGTSLLKAGPCWDPRSWPARPLVRYDDLEDGVPGLSASAEAVHFRFCSPARFFALSVSAHQNVNSVAGGALSAAASPGICVWASGTHTSGSQLVGPVRPRVWLRKQLSRDTVLLIHPGPGRARGDSPHGDCGRRSRRHGA